MKSKVIFPLAAFASTVALIVVLFVTLKIATEFKVRPTRTPVKEYPALLNPVPVIVMTVPTVPEDGVKLVNDIVTNGIGVDVSRS